MLFILTGNVQIGKTRWLQRVIAQLEKDGVRPYGVIAPGIWVAHPGDDGAPPTFEKLGIDNELLPDHELIPFARRADLISAEEAERSCTQAQKAQLFWAIDDGAIETVNGHFEKIAHIGATECTDELPGDGFLVVDEFGRLELLRNEGLTSALALVERGATPTIPHALIIVRKDLLDLAKERFANAPWGGITAISPDDAGLHAIRSAFGLPETD